MARKKEERDSGKYKRITNKQKKFYEGNGKEDAEIIRSQLLPLGLQLREVPGDGNCLFRALGDQMDGHMGLHFRHRQETTNYMLENRGDFSPFVEDDVPFDKHVSQLSQPGTYAGNDAIVAFARLHQVTVVIHQPNTPLWQIKGWEYADEPSTKNKNKPKTGNSQHVRQLHIAYHGGDHYDSIRRLGDTGHHPANIHINIETNTNEPAKVSSYDEHSSSNYCQETTYDSYTNVMDPEHPEANEIEREAIQRSGCNDLLIVRQLIYNNCGNIEAAIEDLLALTISSEPCASSASEKKVANPSNGRPRTFNRKQLEKIRKQERKLASEARKKQSNNPPPCQEIPDETNIVVGKVQCLSI